jgi:hypothetical protein
MIPDSAGLVARGRSSFRRHDADPRISPRPARPGTRDGCQPDRRSGWLELEVKPAGRFNEAGPMAAGGGLGKLVAPPLLAAATVS